MGVVHRYVDWQEPHIEKKLHLNKEVKRVIGKQLVQVFNNLQKMNANNDVFDKLQKISPKKGAFDKLQKTSAKKDVFDKLQETNTNKVGGTKGAVECKVLERRFLRILRTKAVGWQINTRL